MDIHENSSTDDTFRWIEKWFAEKNRTTQKVSGFIFEIEILVVKIIIFSTKFYGQNFKAEISFPNRHRSAVRIRAIRNARFQEFQCVLDLWVINRP